MSCKLSTSIGNQPKPKPCLTVRTSATPIVYHRGTWQGSGHYEGQDWTGGGTWTGHLTDLCGVWCGSGQIWAGQGLVAPNGTWTGHGGTWSANGTRQNGRYLGTGYGQGHVTVQFPALPPITLTVMEWPTLELFPTG